MQCFSTRYERHNDHTVQLLSHISLKELFKYLLIIIIPRCTKSHKDLNSIYPIHNFSYRYGVSDVFEVEDLLERRNIPKVTKCLAQLSKLVC